MMSRLLLLLSLALWPLASFARPWQLDPSSTVRVDVPWHGTQVPVSFPKISGEIDFDDKAPQNAKARITADARAATTGVALVDSLIQSADYLDSKEYPEIVFNLDRLTQTSKSTAEIVGRVTMRGQTHPVTLDATVFRFGPDAADASRFEAGFDITGKIDRTQFGSTGGLPDVGSVLIVNIHLLMASK